MSTNVATMATVQEKVKERIQASFVDLIPPELWEGMVQQHIAEFQRDMLPKLVKDEAEKRVRAMLADEFGKPAWIGHFYGGRTAAEYGQDPSAMVLEIVKQAAPDLVASLFGRIVQGVVMEIRNNPNRY